MISVTKCCLPAALISLSLATNAHAIGLKGLLKGVKKQRKEVPESLLFPNCPDFSGPWEGTCEWSDGTKEHDSLTIEQSNCKAINLGGAEYSVPGVARASHTSFVDNDTSDAIWHAEWNPTRTMLLLHEIGVFVEENTSSTFNFDQTMRLLNGQLVSTSKFKFGGKISSETGSLDENQECTYTKQDPKS